MRRSPNRSTCPKKKGWQVKGSVSAINKLLLGFLFLLPVYLPAQDHYWWANNVGWDGQRFWGDYIIRAQRYLGPNALPIPRLGNGRVPNERSLA